MATFLVAHGAWSAGWGWKKMRPLLRARRHELFTPTYTGLGERVHLASPQVDLETHEVDGERGEALGLPFGPAVLDGNLFPLAVPEIVQGLGERRREVRGRRGRRLHQDAEALDALRPLGLDDEGRGQAKGQSSDEGPPAKRHSLILSRPCSGETRHSYYQSAMLAKLLRVALDNRRIGALHGGSGDDHQQ